jgi:hypothetical protein
MGFCLEVRTADSKDVAMVWQRALERRGIRAEFKPGLTIDENGGLVVVKVLAAPAGLVGVDLTQTVAACFEAWVDEDGVGFNTASGRSAVDFAVQCLCAAAWAEHTGCEYFDPQMDEGARGADAYRLAMAEIESFLSDPANPSPYRAFVDWETLDL